MKLSHNRPIVFFDLETTGINLDEARIVQIAAVRIEPGGSKRTLEMKIKPVIPIEPGAQEVHGISDADVADCPDFVDVARDILEFFENADVGGYNVARFDLPILEREFKRIGLPFSPEGRRVIDAQVIYHRKERRRLSDAVRHYLGREHEDAHDALADIEATIAVMEAQLERYPELPKTVDELDKWCLPENAVDRMGRFVWSGGKACFNFGKHRGKTLEYVANTWPDYLQWMMGQPWLEPAAKRLVRGALEGKFPVQRA